MIDVWIPTVDQRWLLRPYALRYARLHALPFGSAWKRRSIGRISFGNRFRFLGLPWFLLCQRLVDAFLGRGEPRRASLVHRGLVLVQGKELQRRQATVEDKLLTGAASK